MAGYRPIYKRIWKDPDFQDLDPEDKLLFLYLCTNEATTESGIYPLTSKTTSNETGIDRQTVEQRFTNGFFKNIIYDKDKRLIFVKKLKKYGTGGRPDLINKSILNDYSAYTSSILWDEFIIEYPECKELLNGCQTVVQLSDTLPYDNNKDNDNNIDNDIFGEFKNVKLSSDEYNKLLEKHGEKKTGVMIESLSAYMVSKKTKYNSHYATISNWFRRDEKDTKAPPSKYGDKWR